MSNTKTQVSLGTPMLQKPKSYPLEININGSELLNQFIETSKEICLPAIMYFNGLDVLREF